MIRMLLGSSVSTIILTIILCIVVNIVTITCGNIKLVDIELETIPSTVLNTIGSMTIYHCAESISANQTVSSVCSSDGVSRWNPDPTSHACVSATSDTSGNWIFSSMVDNILSHCLGKESVQCLGSGSLH